MVTHFIHLSIYFNDISYSTISKSITRALNVKDVKAAFYSVDRTALWKTLHANGLPDILLKLIDNLHENTGETFCVSSDLSAKF